MSNTYSTTDGLELTCNLPNMGTSFSFFLKGDQFDRQRLKVQNYQLLKILSLPFSLALIVNHHNNGSR